MKINMRTIYIYIYIAISNLLSISCFTQTSPKNHAKEKQANDKSAEFTTATQYDDDDDPCRCHFNCNNANIYINTVCATNDANGKPACEEDSTCSKAISDACPAGPRNISCSWIVPVVNNPVIIPPSIATTNEVCNAGHADCIDGTPGTTTCIGANNLPGVCTANPTASNGNQIFCDCKTDPIEEIHINCSTKPDKTSCEAISTYCKWVEFCSGGVGCDVHTTQPACMTANCVWFAACENK